MTDEEIKFNYKLIKQMKNETKMIEWINVKDALPKETGSYLVRNSDHIESPAFYVRTLSGKYIWLTPSSEFIIKEWSKINDK